ncbi:unnamed protein product [Rangifer tarandus platyrhynchus]|uniref:Uncharacterized protein n=2 Tax=Rangifer tarandus platyrhynchus TaxID=3082113 RepID=A0ABN8Z325_RANTA|nr:unnamed protein product [Rangifer tarandus platyrhynchus]
MRFWHRAQFSPGVSAERSKPGEAQSARAKACWASGQGRHRGGGGALMPEDSPSVSPQCSVAGWKPQAGGRAPKKEKGPQDFPGGPVVKILLSDAGGAGLIPGQGTKIPHASWPQKTQTIL